MARPEDESNSHAAGSGEARRPGAAASSIAEARRQRAAFLAALDEVEVRIEKLVQGGDGLARLEGAPILVARTAPGDLVRLRIVERRPQYARGEILELLEPGPGRRRPPCPVYDQCGGCDLQHLEDGLQARLKAAAARETLERLGRLRFERSPELVTGAAWGYRSRAQWHLERESGQVRAGYRRRGSDELVPTTVCPILERELEAELEQLPARLRAVEELPRRLDVLLGDDGPCYAPVLGELARGSRHIAVGDHRFELDARVFFQGHRGLLARLVELAVGEEEGGETAWDLYAGVGLFSLPLARLHRRLVAVESDRIAARYLRRNTAHAGGAQVEVRNESVESFLSRADGRAAAIDRVLLDPPRTGLTRAVADRLLALAPRLVTYVSCQPATLARDLARLTVRYRLVRVTFVDLFPQTAHLETVAQLERVGGTGA